MQIDMPIAFSQKRLGISWLIVYRKIHTKDTHINNALQRKQL